MLSATYSQMIKKKQYKENANANKRSKREQSVNLSEAVKILMLNL